VTFTPVIKLGDLDIAILNRTYLLAANASRVVLREDDPRHAGGVDYVAESSVVDHHVRSLAPNCTTVGVFRV
jgi:DNA-binding response OmpR family regulator